MHSPGSVIIGVCLEDLAPADVASLRVLAYAEVLGVGVCLERAWTHSVIGVRCRDVHACADIETKGFEAVYLIVGCSTADETGGAGIADIVVKL